jgi:uncharacterized protein (TIGR02145 family)
MRTVFRFSAVVIIFLATLAFYSCTEKTASPVVVTIPASDISCVTAISGGVVTDEGGLPITRRGVCWSQMAEPTTANNKTSESGGFGPFKSVIDQLSGGTKYYIRSYATNKTGTSYGNQQTFTTMKSLPAELTTAVITSITAVSAVSGGNITNVYGAPVTERGICWSTETNPSIASITKTKDGTGAGTFVSNLTQLYSGTKYYARAYATTVAGTSYGNEVTFTTSQLSSPELTTTAITSVTASTAVSGGNITNDNGGIVIARGVCWSTSTGPTITLSTRTLDGTGSGIFISTLSGLQSGTTYYVRAYATNSAGTGYGNEMVFTAMVTDADGNLYNAIQIGTQIWMAENLKTTRFNDNSVIPLITDNSSWAALTTPGLCWYNNDEATNKPVFGALYSWYAVDAASNGGKNICPVGWHIPSDEEWTTLTNYLGGESVAGGKLKEVGTAHWQSPNTEATNESGFTALPGGGRFNDGTYNQILNLGIWWSASLYGLDFGWYRHMAYDDRSVYRNSINKLFGYSVRCLRDF